MINRLHFSIEIKATKDVIWEALWGDAAYRDWISIFSEGSYAVTDHWKEGSKVYFLSPDKSGIYSIIEKHIPTEIIKFKHIGSVVNGKEQIVDEATQKWSGATETYTLTQSADTNTLTIDIDVLDEHLEFMSDRLPKALDRIKQNCS